MERNDIILLIAGILAAIVIWNVYDSADKAGEKVKTSEHYVAYETGYDAGYKEGYEEGYREAEKYIASEALDYTGRMWAIFDEQDEYSAEEALKKMFSLMQEEDAAMRMFR